MVGAPKNLHDLAKIEADVRITCRRCRYEHDWSRDELARHLRAIGGSTVWSEITRHMRCARAGCGSAELRALPVPYSRRPANMPRQIGKLDARVLAAALAILDSAVARSAGQGVATIEVQLALLVLHRYLREPELTRRFWTRAGVAIRSVDASLVEPLNAIRARLVQQGWIAPAVLLEPLRHWPWASPAPPGWLAQPGNPRPPMAEDDA